MTLTASAGKGSAFDGWTGPCTGTAACVVSLAAATSVQAFFLRDCAVPKVKGKALRAAKRALKAHDCTAGRITRAFSKHVKKGRVISQRPKPHRLLKHGARSGSR